MVNATLTAGWIAFWGAVGGAVVGGAVAGLATFLVARWQMNKQLEAARTARDDERADAKQAREEERAEARSRRAEEQRIADYRELSARLESLRDASHHATSGLDPRRDNFRTVSLSRAAEYMSLRLGLRSLSWGLSTWDKWVTTSIDDPGQDYQVLSQRRFGGINRLAALAVIDTEAFDLFLSKCDEIAFDDETGDFTVIVGDAHSTPFWSSTERIYVAVECEGSETVTAGTGEDG